MLVSVSKRTGEIGLRMAVGARSQHILRQIVVEATVLCLCGGATGIACLLRASVFDRLARRRLRCGYGRKDGTCAGDPRWPARRQRRTRQSVYHCWRKNNRINGVA